MTDNQHPFIIFIEGADGVGKTTTSKKLLEKINQENNYNVNRSGIMEKTVAGTELRRINITEEISDELRFVSYCFGTFYGIDEIFADKMSHVVIVDRSQASTYAQNICAPDMSAPVKNAAITVFNSLNKEFEKKYAGRYFNFYLHADPQSALNRIHAERGALDVFERRGVGFQEKIRRGFHSYYSGRDDVYKIDTLLSNPDAVVDLIYQQLVERFPGRFVNNQCLSTTNA